MPMYYNVFTLRKREEKVQEEIRMKKAIPAFKDFEEEARFWEEHSVMDFVSEADVSDFLRYGGNKSVVVTLRMEPLVREQTKKIAKEQGKSYQTLMRDWIYDGLRSELEKKYGKRSEQNEPLAKLVSGMKRDIEDIKAAITDIDSRGVVGKTRK